AMADKYSPAAMAEALTRSKGLVSIAARSLGCSPETIRQYRQRHPLVERAITDARDELVDTAELSLRKRVMEGEGWAVSLVLKTLGRDRGYVERHEQQHTGADGGPIRFLVVAPAE